jgi:hypothetical protein
MSQTIEVSGRLRKGDSPKDYNNSRGDDLSIPKINRGFDRLAEELLTKRSDANASLGRTSRTSKFLSVANAVKNKLAPLIQGTFTKPDKYYLPPGFLPSTPPSVSPNYPTGGGYKTRKYKKATTLAKKPKKATTLAKKPRKPTILAKKPKKPTTLAKKPKKVKT